MNNTGWIKIWRQLLEWEWSDVPEMVALWVRLLIKATHEDMQWHGVTIVRGQLVTTAAKLAAESGMTVQQVRTCLDRLKASNQIATQTTNKYTIISVCKYDDYQDIESTEQQTNGKQATRKQQTNNTQATNQQQTNNTHNKNIRIKEQEEQENIIINPLTPLQGDAPVTEISEKEKRPQREKAAARAVTRYDRAWEEIYSRLTSNTFFWTKRENMAVQSIVGRIDKMMKEAGRDPTDDEKESALRWFVESLWNLDDAWIRTNFVPHVIDGKFNEYYNQLKQHKNGKTRNNTSNPTGVSADYLASIARDLGADL